MRIQGVAQGGLEPAVELDHVDVRDARGQVLAEHAEPAADLQHDVLRRERRRAGDDVQEVGVDQEVLAQLAIRAHAELGQAAQARLGGELAHHPKRRAPFACTASSSAS